MRRIQEKYQRPLIRWPTWSLARLANFNNPSQLGRTPSADPYVQLYYLAISALLSSALLCWTMKKKNWSRMSHTILYWPKVSFIWRVCHITLTGPKSVLLIPYEYHKSVSNHSYWSQINGGHPSIGSTVDTSMRPSIVLLWSLTPFPCSFDQMRGTSHESQTTWIGCLERRTNHPVHRRTNHPAPQWTWEN